MMHRILIAAFVLLLACPVLGKPVARPTNRRYLPIYAHKFKPAEKYARHSLQGDFVWAAESSTLRTATIRWRSFLLAYGERELDSATQARLISIAKYELMRIYYLVGDLEAGDKLWKELDPLKLF
ncbi:MAG TPA: hypothetical protein VGQ41_27655 [Pyrinomonadaceae bacterium]|jgi:hypothetical protein|nr:hypothetical protein [Pyrinomonadaceae bacterium]